MINRRERNEGLAESEAAYREKVRRTVESAPPLTPEQLEYIVSLLSPIARPGNVA